MYRTSLQKTAAVLFHHGFSWTDATMASVAWIGRQLGEQASLLSYVDIFWFLAIASFVAAPIPLLIRKTNAEPSPEAFHAE
jgi:DHA2 family multidrug resistance protein